MKARRARTSFISLAVIAWSKACSSDSGSRTKPRCGIILDGHAARATVIAFGVADVVRSGSIRGALLGLDHERHLGVGARAPRGDQRCASLDHDIAAG